MKAQIKNIISIFCLLMVSIVVGCAHLYTMKPFARTSPSLPQLSGKSVLVLPPIATGGEAEMIESTDTALKTIFSGDIADVRFIYSEEPLTKWKKNRQDYELLRAQVSSCVPAHVEPAGEKMTLINTDVLAGKKQPNRYQIILMSSTAESEFAPRRLDFSVFNLPATDYVLVSIPYGKYIKTTSIFAIYGVLPIIGVGEMGHLPHGLFALYESKTGNKVWEGQVGSLQKTIVRSEEYRGQVVMSRSYDVVLTAAYLMTGNIEIPLDRIVTTALSQNSKNAGP